MASGPVRSTTSGKSGARKEFEALVSYDKQNACHSLARLAIPAISQAMLN